MLLVPVLSMVIVFPVVQPFPVGMPVPGFLPGVSAGDAALPLWC
jgi:hypothetical protein